MQQTNAITIFRKRASRVVLKYSSSEKNSRQLSDYIFWHRSHLWSSSGDITKQPWIRRELFTLAALSMTSLKWASSAMYWVIVLSCEWFWNSRVGNISFTSSSTLCFGRIYLQDMIYQHAVCHILLRIQTFLIEIFGRGVPSPLFFRLSFLLPFNSIYTVANR